VKEPSQTWMHTHETRDYHETSHPNQGNYISMILHPKPLDDDKEMKPATRSVTAEANEVGRACHQSI